MSKLLLIILILIILFSYKAIEKLFFRFLPKLVNNALWSSPGYYVWCGLLLVIMLIVNPLDLILRLPSNHKTGLQYVFFYIVSIFAFTSRKNHDNIGYIPFEWRLSFIHICCIVPIFEEVAFRGLILPMTINLFGSNFNLIIILNALLFSAFHLNYLPLEKKSYFDFFMFFVHGYMLSSVAYITGSIMYSIICHVINNSVLNIYGNLRARKLEA